MGDAAGSSSGHATTRWSLGGMTALVTGGTRGIGHAVVEELAGLGASVHTCSRKEADLTECLRKWAAKGFRVTGSVCDLSSREQRDQLIREVSATFNGKLNILVNNVGTNIRKPTVEYSAEEYSFLMATNLESAYHLCQLAHPLLKASGMGSIVFISSVAGVVALSSGSIYAAAKAAMNQMTKNLACEWAKDNIRTNSVAPWYIKTKLVEHLLNDKDSLQRIIDRTPPPPSWRARRSVVAGRISVPTCCFLHNWADNFSRWRNDCKWLLSKWVKIKAVLGFVCFSAFLYLNLQMSNCFDHLKRVALVSR